MIAKKRYALLDADDEDDDDKGTVSIDSATENEKKQHPVEKGRKKSDVQNEDDEDIAQGEENRQIRRRTKSDEDNDLEWMQWFSQFKRYFVFSLPTRPFMVS
ncbi:hypothetical protein TorRG33x02_149530 [Trema orientale]|uniref:Uncharacterized protein n=1 Tax=Trema orientale TaxID=63057 RepID=A0A2P5EUR8_TREOI|nr:hypothetical protein TorRG33x02_149530 [Trema orientale]